MLIASVLLHVAFILSLIDCICIFFFVALYYKYVANKIFRLFSPEPSKAMEDAERDYVQQVCLLLIRNVELDKALLPLLMLADEVMSHEQLSQEQKTKSLAALQGVKRRLSIMEAAMEDLTEQLAHGNQ
jgi:hypothetical protein